VAPDSCKFWIYKWESKIMMNSGDAEAKTKDFINKRHALVENLYIAMMFPEGNVWVLQGDVEFKRLHFFSTVMAFEAQVNMDTGEVTAYLESHIINPKKQQKDRSS
jgi:hypothetical protein